jgi:hypothetical protein
MCGAKAVPRSNRRVTLVTRQPSFSAPTRSVTGTRAPSRNTSQKWDSPSMVRRGRTSTPGWSMSRISHVMPWWRGPSGSVRTSSSQWSATWARVLHTFWPVTTYSSPSRTARVRSDARSEPASGSEKPWHHTLSPRRMRGRWRRRCSSVPSAIRVGPAWAVPTKLMPT